MPDGNDRLAVAGAVSVSGAPYVLEVTNHPSPVDDLVTLKRYFDTGTVEWSKQYTGRNDLEERPYPASLLVDGSENAYVALLGTGIELIKYSAGGSVLRNTKYTAIFFYQRIIFDSDGNIAIALYPFSQNFVLRYDVSGNLLTETNLHWIVNNEDEGYIDVDGWGSVYFFGAKGGDLFKIDSAGALLWQRESIGFHRIFTIDTTGNIFMTDQSYNADDIDIDVIKTDPDGEWQWWEQYDGGYLCEVSEGGGGEDDDVDDDPYDDDATDDDDTESADDDDSSKGGEDDDSDDSCAG